MQLGCLPILRIPWAVGVRTFVKLGYYQSGNFASDVFAHCSSSFEYKHLQGSLSCYPCEFIHSLYSLIRQAQTSIA